MGRCFAAGLVGLGAAWFGLASWGACAPGSVDLRWQGGEVHFTAELADTEALRETGLMHRSKLAGSAAMLFAYDQPGHVYYWMKNTEIPLDMIFADASGTVLKVHPNAIPQDETAIDGGADVQFVLEINGGLAKRLGIAPGAELRAAVIDQTRAVWSCTGN